MEKIYFDTQAFANSWLPDISPKSLKSITEKQATLIRNKNEKLVYSIYDECGNYPFILKIWRYHGLRYVVKELLEIGNPYSEFESIKLLNNLGVASPKLLFFGKDKFRFTYPTYYQITEYIGPGKDAQRYVKELLRINQREEIENFTKKIIALTGSMINISLIDIDHRMTNLMVDDSGSPVKIDLELANIVPKFRRIDKKVGKMVGSIIFTYAFAVQPHTELAQAFAEQLFASLDISSKARIVAAKVVRQALLEQYTNTGICTEINFKHLVRKT